MVRSLLLLSAIALSLPLSAALAQEAPVQTVSGTRLEIVATGEVTRVPDIARISTGVVTIAPTATAAIAQNARQMTSVRAALGRAGIADRDIQTSALNLNPEYRHVENNPPQLTGYRASNEVTVRFRNSANTGRIIDALVSQGANQINGPMLSIDKPEQALDEARVAALKTARTRADLYAQALGRRVKRILTVSESGPQRRPAYQQSMDLRARGESASSVIDPGEQVVAVNLLVSFEFE